MLQHLTCPSGRMSLRHAIEGLGWFQHLTLANLEIGTAHFFMMHLHPRLRYASTPHLSVWSDVIEARHRGIGLVPTPNPRESSDLNCALFHDAPPSTSPLCFNTSLVRLVGCH